MNPLWDSVCLFTTVHSLSRNCLNLRIQTEPIRYHRWVRMQRYTESLISVPDMLALHTVYKIHYVASIRTKEYVHLERKRVGGWCFFTQIEPNWPLPYSTVPVQWLRDARPAGWVTYCSICASTMLRAQNRAGKGSILLLLLLLLLLFIYDPYHPWHASFFSGLGVRSSVFRANRLFSWVKKRFTHENHSRCSFVMSDGSKSLKVALF